MKAMRVRLKPRGLEPTLELAYERLGEARAEPVVMIMGFGVQMITWPDGFCRALVERGFQVVRFDNRDVGQSSRAPRGYTLDDMADDVAALLDALHIPSAHVVGASMGGFIAQLVALRHHERVRSLVSIMSSTGNRAVGQPRPELLPLLMTPAPLDPQGYLETRLRSLKLIASPGFPFDEARARDVITRSWQRGYDPAGVQRQLMAVLAAPDRTTLLQRIRAPTLVVHGSDDGIVHRSGGEATARAIPGARLLMVEGMAHDLPEGAWPRIADAIRDNARRVTPVADKP